MIPISLNQGTAPPAKDTLITGAVDLRSRPGAHPATNPSRPNQSGHGQAGHVQKAFEDVVARVTDIKTGQETIKVDGETDLSPNGSEQATEDPMPQVSGGDDGTKVPKSQSIDAFETAELTDAKTREAAHGEPSRNDLERAEFQPPVSPRAQENPNARHEPGTNPLTRSSGSQGAGPGAPMPDRIPAAEHGLVPMKKAETPISVPVKNSRAIDATTQAMLLRPASPNVPETPAPPSLPFETPKALGKAAGKPETVLVRGQGQSPVVLHEQGTQQKNTLAGPVLRPAERPVTETNPSPQAQVDPPQPPVVHKVAKPTRASDMVFAPANNMPKPDKPMPNSGLPRDRILTDERTTHARKALPDEAKPPVGLSPSRTATNAELWQAASQPGVGNLRQADPRADIALQMASPHAFLAASDQVFEARSGNLPLSSHPQMPRHVAHQIAAAVQSASGNLVEITLKPAELGPVRLSLASTEMGVTVHVMAERPETLDLMRRNIQELAAEFRDIGYEQADFRFDKETPPEHHDQHAEQDGSSNTDQALSTGPVETSRSPEPRGVINLDRVDIRI